MIDDPEESGEGGRCVMMVNCSSYDGGMEGGEGGMDGGGRGG